MRRNVLNAVVIPGMVTCALTIAGFAQNSHEAYQKHAARVRRLLPSYSALPPTVDLSKPNPGTERASQAWEREFSGVMREISDPGVGSKVGPGSISITTVEYGIPIRALPARLCDTIVLAEPVTSNVYVAYNRRLVYSTFVLHISKLLKGHIKRDLSGRRMNAALMGGTVRFPSGHLETFLWANEGFMEIGKQYLLFMRKPIRGDSTFVVPEAYLNKDGVTFPINTVGGSESTYAGMPFIKFEAKVEEAIAKNVDTN